MGLGLKQVSEDEHQVFDKWLQPTQTPKQFQSNKRSHQQLQQPEPLNCPRCDSTNTKFCYYNNYNKTQPRHFCKACKRHWTKGGTLRNVPVGGGRKNKRHKPSPISTTTTTIAPQFSNSYKTMNIHHQPSFLNNDVSFINLLPSDHIHNLQFSFSSSNLEANTSSSDVNYATCFKKVENMEESVITSIIPGVDESWESEVGGVMELPSSSYWNWNEFDTTVPDLTIPNWDETEMI